MIDKYNRIGIFIILAVGLQLVFVVMSIYAHELTHKFDYRNVEKFNEELCIIKNCDDGEAGSYTFNADKSQLNEINRIGKYTETNAWQVTFSFMLLYILIILIIFKIMIREVYENGRHKSN